MMKSKDQVLDVNGEILREGDPVVLLNAPDELLSDLPSEDRADIKAQVGKAMLVQSFDDHGHVELEFKSEDEMMHFIWVKPLCLRKST